MICNTLAQRSSGFKDTAPPLLSPTDQPVSRTEQIVVNRPFQVVTIAMENRPLNEVIRPAGNLPGVAGHAY
jgi:hypothetical protein